MRSASFESLEYLFTENKNSLYAVSFKNSHCEDVTRYNFGKKTILIKRTDGGKMDAIWGDEDEIFKLTNVAEKLSKKRVTGLELDTHSSDYKEKLAKELNIKLIVSPWAMQKKFENKEFFDNFLRENSLPVAKGFVMKSADDISKIDFFPIALQVPVSDGSKGTFIINSKLDLERCISDNSLSFPLLCRQFIQNGYPLGISILIGPKKMVFSAPRLQAYFHQKDGTSQYFGIQWLKRSSLHDTVIKNLNKSLKNLGKKMQEIGFRGIANIDLIVKGDDVYFIECNPRLGGSTPQIALKPELIHGLIFVKELRKITNGGELSKHKPFIPETEYQGFNMDIEFLSHRYMNQPINKPWKVGFYKVTDGGLVYVSPKLEDFLNPSGVFIYHALPSNARITKQQFLGFALSHLPLLEIKGDEYKFNERGLKFAEFLSVMVGNSLQS